MYNDTIAAISTPVGEGGIGMVRLSGPKAREILAAIFVPGRRSPSSVSGEQAPVRAPLVAVRRLRYGS